MPFFQSLQSRALKTIAIAVDSTGRNVDPRASAAIARSLVDSRHVLPFHRATLAYNLNILSKESFDEGITMAIWQLKLKMIYNKMAILRATREMRRSKGLRVVDFKAKMGKLDEERSAIAVKIRAVRAPNLLTWVLTF